MLRAKVLVSASFANETAIIRQSFVSSERNDSDTTVLSSGICKSSTIISGFNSFARRIVLAKSVVSPHISRSEERQSTYHNLLVMRLVRYRTDALPPYNVDFGFRPLSRRCL